MFANEEFCQRCGTPAQLLWQIQILGIWYIVVAVVVIAIFPSLYPISQ